jgi:hypothetical protein
VGELISAGFALLLLADTFALKWFGVAGVPDPSYARPAVSSAEDGWTALTLTRWVILAAIAVSIGSVFLHASQRRHGTKTDTSRVVATVGTAAALLVAYRVLVALPTADRVIDQKLGAFLGLLCTVGIAWGGYESLVEQRARTRAGGPAPRTRRRRRMADGRGTR